MSQGDKFSIGQCSMNIHKTPEDVAQHGIVPCYREPGHEGECKGFWRLVLEARGRGEITRGELMDVIDALTTRDPKETPSPDDNCTGSYP